MNESSYNAPWWLPGGHLQTIYARYLQRGAGVEYRRERWSAPDGDFVDVDWIDGAAENAPLVVVFHGLEGCSRSHYVLGLMRAVRRAGWRAAVPHFRGCSGEPNFLPRSYHSGDSDEVDWILRRLQNRIGGMPVYAVGVSLGGNMLLKWLGERGAEALALVRRAVAVSVPVDLAAAAAVLDCGVNRHLYTGHFLRTLRRKVLAKIIAHELDVDPKRVAGARTFRAFDDLFTAPFHGFKDADEYWSRASSKPWLRHIAVPTLLVHALNDPFLPAEALPGADDVSGAVTLEFSAGGGHAGFVQGRFPGNTNWLPRRILSFFQEAGAD